MDIESNSADAKDSSLSSDLLAVAKQALDLPADAPLEFIRERPDPKGGRTLEYSVTMSIKLEGADFGIASGVTVDEPAIATLQLDAEGKLKASNIAPIDKNHLAKVKDQVRKLASSNQIGTSRSTMMSGEKTKPWIIESDAQGHNRLKRAFIG